MDIEMVNEASIEAARQTVQANPHDHPDRARWLNNLSTMLESRYERTGEMKDIEEAIASARQALHATPQDHPDLAALLNSLGNKLRSRYEQIGLINDLEEAVALARQAVQVTPHDHSNLAALLHNLGIMLGRRYERTGQINDLEEAIVLARRAFRATPQDHPRRAGCANGLSVWLLRGFERTGKMENLEEAISLARQAVQVTPGDHPDQARWLNSLGTMLESRYERTGEIKDIEEAIVSARQALHAIPQDHPDLAMMLNSLSIRLGREFERTGEMKILEEAISLARQAVQVTPCDHPNLAMILNSLSIWLGRGFERTGEMENLEEAISLARQAVQVTPGDHPDQARWLNNLGTMLESRYERTGEMKDIEEAIASARQAVQATPQDHPGLANRLNNLGNRLHRRYLRTDDIEDLEDATALGRQAVQATPRDHPDRAGRLNNLGNVLGSQYERTGEMKDLEEAVAIVRQAVKATPDDHPGQARRLNSLATCLWRRHELTGEMRDLEEAIAIARHAVQATPNDHRDRAGWLHNIGSWLGRRFEQNREMKDLEEAFDHLSSAFSCRAAIPILRVRAAARCLDLVVSPCETQAFVKLGRDALDLLPAIHTRILDQNDQQFVLSAFTGIASALSALLLAEHRVDEAIECLEKGRANNISRLLENHSSDISMVLQRNPTLAREYQALMTEINLPVHSAPDSISARHTVARRRQAAMRLETCLEHIRAVPGCDRFLLGQPASAMQDSIDDGYIVYVNIAKYQSDAIILSRHSVQTVSLSGLRIVDVKLWRTMEWSVKRRSDARQKNDEFLEYLAWLWRTCVKPIFDHISMLHDTRSRDLPRVWWIGCGLASSMPFHAAGLHVLGSRENAFSNAISSFTPSMRALNHARSYMKRATCNHDRQDHVLITTMPTTPKAAGKEKALKDLMGVLEEKDVVSAEVAPFMCTTHLSTPSADSVMHHLKGCRIAHFACHGISETADPSSSGLILQRDGPDGKPEQDRLSVYRVSRLRLEQAHIAYLSACSTAENRATHLSDEVIHIVSGFQVAGFPHVVGSMWPAGDAECVMVARHFYSQLFSQKTELNFGDREIAKALQEAVLAVRTTKMDMPLLWAQFVHFGA